MGQFVKGTWRGDADFPHDRTGHFVRPDAPFRNWVTESGEAGPSGAGGFKAEPDRYHLIISLACPWAHRTLIFRRLKSLESMISLSVVHWLLGERGWTFEEGPGVIPDPIFGASELREFYVKARPDYSGRVTVPVLWDKKTSTIVNNESSEIIRMFNSAFDTVGARAGNYYPRDRRDEIDELNTRIYATVNNGVYKAGFATTQAAYEEAVAPLFETLDWLEERLSQSRFLCDDTLTEADIRLFTTLVRFDPVYNGHFKCNIRRVIDYKNLWAYTRDIYQIPGVAPTVNFVHIKRHYYQSHKRINPTGVVPVGPVLDFDEPAERGKDVARLLTF
jgi:glutathionyl-hydroquinone reductase